MSLRPPARYSATSMPGMGGSDGPADLLEHEIAAEMASALGRAGQKVETALEVLRQASPEMRSRALKAAANAVHAYFIQREMCGLRRHQAAIRDYAIPTEVLVRLGAS